MAQRGASAERILAVAERMVLERGFSGTSLDEILATAGLSKGAFFHHFRGKGDLARALVERYQKNHAALFEAMESEAEARTSDPLDATILFLRRFESFIGAHSRPPAGCIFASFTHEDANFDDAVRAFVAASLKRWTALYETRFGAILARYQPKIAISATELAEMIVVIIEGGFVLSRSYGDAKLVARQSRQFRNYLELLFMDRERRASSQG
jgi:TetR/AcrR family transcriptional repressor of nem operon